MTYDGLTIETGRHLSKVTRTAGKAAPYNPFESKRYTRYFGNRSSLVSEIVLPMLIATAALFSTLIVAILFNS
jgi:hypothetical protein